MNWLLLLPLASLAIPAARPMVRLCQSFFSRNPSVVQMLKSMLVTTGAAVCCALLGFAALAGCAQEKPLLNQSLAWTPTHQIDLGVTQSFGTPAAVRFETFTDSARNPALVGENVEQAKPRLVTTVDSVGRFVSRHLASLFAQAGYVSGGANAARVLSGRVSKFFVREHNLYRATVILHLTVSNRRGKVLWRGTVWGANKTFGRSYRLYNYNQVLSDAVVNAADKLLKNPALRAALMRR